MGKMRTKLVINGIWVSKTGSLVSAFYTVFDNTAVLDVAFDKDGELLAPNSLTYGYFRSREKQLSKKYGILFCPSHSRLLINGKCDIFARMG